MTAADWIQGPYVYKLYEHYGFTIEQNGQLFIAGFGASLVLGTVAGSMADKFGRKFGKVDTVCISFLFIYPALKLPIYASNNYCMHSCLIKRRNDTISPILVVYLFHWMTKR